MKMFKVASLFCGCGGADLGTIGGFSFLNKKYKKLPFEISYAVDFDASAIFTYNHNFKSHGICKDILHVNANTEIPDVDIIMGGFPCQSFSTVNPTKNTNDARANLYKEIVRILSVKRPSAFVCENVKGLLTLQRGRIIKKIIADFSAVGYTVKFQLLNAADYGVPQRRERLIIVGIRKDLNFNFQYPMPMLDEEHWIPLSKIVHSLDITEKKYYFSSRAVQGMKNAKNNMKRGLWQDLSKPCLTITSHLAKTSLNSRDPVLLVDSENEIYRRFTPQEAAGIQSFPSTFCFPGSETQAYKQIGNAVPPVLMWHVMRQLAEALQN
jgi:DNA (cytosine-5)-methyltransferase 1